MPLSIIGAGFGRTGTSSMKQALELLGVGPCHHMSEVLSLDDQRTKWKAIANGTKPDWDDVFANYNASVDWPSSHYWRDLAEHFPNAKILLTVRSSESWYTSMTNTIFKVLKEENEPDGVGTRIITEATFGGILDDKDHAIAIFEKNTSDVKAAISKDRLLVYSVGDGWEPLCQFLNLPVPSEPFPRSNSSEEFNQSIQARREQEALEKSNPEQT